MAIRPQDFYTETPPPRTIGTECEYNMQFPPGSVITASHFVGMNALKAAGVISHGSGYLGQEFGAGRVYPDVGHVEFDTREAVGPAQAAVEDISGIDRVSNIIEAVGLEHIGMYRLAGTYFQDGKTDSGATTSAGRSSGYHESYLLPRDIVNDPLIDMVVPTALATRVWAMSGTLRGTGFVLSQKVWGNGGNPVERSLLRRTDHGNKPMVIIPSEYDDYDTIGSADWARVEVRMADPGLSLVNRFASFAGFSLVLRLIEQQGHIPSAKFAGMTLMEPVSSAKQYAADLSLTKTALTMTGKNVSALDIQELLLDVMENELSAAVQLPEDERLGMVVIRGLIDALRRSDPATADYDKMARARIEFATKHQFITEGREPGLIKAHDIRAQNRLLAWDRVLPIGNGQRYWAHISQKDPLTHHIVNLAAATAPSKRSVARAKLIDASDGVNIVSNWSTYAIKDQNNTTTCSLGNPSGQ